MRIVGHIIFSIALILIIGISAIDAYLNLKHPVTIRSELNPLARQVLAWTGDHYFLISLKLFGTSLVAAILTAYYCYNNQKGFIVALSMAVIQNVILVFMLV